MNWQNISLQSEIESRDHKLAIEKGGHRKSWQPEKKRRENMVMKGEVETVAFPPTKQTQ